MSEQVMSNESGDLGNDTPTTSKLGGNPQIRKPSSAPISEKTAPQSLGELLISKLIILN